jgi:uncharacterized membrane protein YfcA
MDELTFLITLFSFGLSFLFALGGVGAAVALVPVLTWIGVPLEAARPTGLFVNTISMTGASYSNIKEKRLDFKIGLPIIIASALTAPLGAFAGTIIPKKTVLIAFVIFLIFSGTMLLFFKGSKFAGQYKDDRPLAAPVLIGAMAGFLSGLLGVGGGGLISPLMIMIGFNPKKIAAVTAFAVPFSSLLGFITYAAMGTIDFKILLFAGIAAYAGGYTGTIFMQKKMKPEAVKKFLGFFLILIAVKLFLNLF